MGALVNSKWVRPRRTFVGLALAAVTVSACGNTSLEAASAENEAYATSTMRARLANADLGSSVRPLREYLAEGAFDQVVVGKVLGGGFGVAYRLPEGDGEPGAPNDGQTQVDEGSPDAAWKTVHATVEVEERLDAGEDPGVLTVGFVVAPSVSTERFVKGLMSLGRVVLFLAANNPVFDYDHSVLAVGREASLVARVADDGTLSMPFIADQEPTALRDSETLDALRRASPAGEDGA